MNLKDNVTHASHTILYAPVPGKLFGKYDMKYTVMVCTCVCLCVCVVCMCTHVGRCV